MNYPRIYNAAVDLVDRNVTQGRAAKTAFIDPNEALTYGELQARCNRMANLLVTYGVGRESRVALLLLDTVDFPTAFWGAIKAGVVPVALNTLLTTEQYAYILADSRAKALFISAPLLAAVQPILGQLPCLKHIFVAGGAAPPFALSLRGELQVEATQFAAADTCSAEADLWL
jgi:4-hydroxybenzoate-CoA ligase